MRPSVRIIAECEKAISSDLATSRIRARGAADISNRRRVGMCALLFAAAFSVLGFRLTAIVLGEYEPRKFAAVSKSGAERQEIFDRNGALLATNLPMRKLEISGKQVWDAVETVATLGSIFPSIDQIDLKQKLEQRRYVSLRVDVTPAKEQAVFALGLPGVHFKSASKRYYPQTRTASHLVGHLEDGKKGVMGLERVLEKKRTDRAGALTTTIDVRVQQIVESELAAGVQKYKAKAGWVGVLDVETGEIVSLASFPDFDPNDPAASTQDARRNRAIYDRYEFGSAFKIFTAAMALDLDKAEEMSVYDARFGSYKVAGETIRDYHGENRLLTLSEVVQHSSNIGAARIAGDVGIREQKRHLEKLGFFDPLPLSFIERRSPELPGQWGPVEAATISYGHGISVTPLHLLSAFAAIINGGTYHTPVFSAYDDALNRTVISENSSAVMRRILRRVITNGTASAAEVPGYFPIGKTATADKPAKGGYNRSTRLSSFIGAFPGHAPRYAVLVSLDEPQPAEGTFGFATAGWNAAPIFSSITSQIAPVLGVLPSAESEAVRTFVAAVDAPLRVETKSAARGAK